MNSFDSDEKVLWQGGVNKKYIKTSSFIFGIICFLIFIIGIVLLYLTKKTSSYYNDEDVSIKIICSTFLITMIISWILAITSLKKYKYIITNKRIIVFSGLLNYAQRSLNIQEITGYDFIYSFLDKFSSIDCASIDFTSPSIHTQSYNARAGMSQFCFRHIGKIESENVMKILNDLKNQKTK